MTIKDPRSRIKTPAYKALLKSHEKPAQIGLFTKPIWRKKVVEIKIIELNKN